MKVPHAARKRVWPVLKPELMESLLNCSGYILDPVVLLQLVN